MNDVEQQLGIIDVLGSRGQSMARRSAKDVREAPVYTASEAARYLHLPPAVVRAWAFQQVIKPADRESRRLSFLNLIELLVLAAIRRKHAVSLPQVRRALRFLEKRFTGIHPLADHRFQTNGLAPFIEKLGEILGVSGDGQAEMRELLDAYLECVERDSRGAPVKLYLPSLKSSSAVRGVIVIDPRVGFGRPVLDGTGIRTEVILDRFRAGESIDALVLDYGRSREEIEAVLRSGLAAAA